MGKSRGREATQAGFASVKARRQGKCPLCLAHPDSKNPPPDHVHVACPACLDRGALGVDGRVRTEGGELRGATQTVGRRKLSTGCETCGGCGQVPELDTRDPYQHPLTPEQAKRVHVALTRRNTSVLR